MNLDNFYSFEDFVSFVKGKGVNYVRFEETPKINGTSSVTKFSLWPGKYVFPKTINFPVGSTYFKLENDCGYDAMAYSPVVISYYSKRCGFEFTYNSLGNENIVNMLAEYDENSFESIVARFTSRTSSGLSSFLRGNPELYISNHQMPVFAANEDYMKRVYYSGSGWVEPRLRIVDLLYEIKNERTVEAYHNVSSFPYRGNIDVDYKAQDTGEFYRYVGSDDNPNVYKKINYGAREDWLLLANFIILLIYNDVQYNVSTTDPGGDLRIIKYLTSKDDTSSDGRAPTPNLTSIYPQEFSFDLQIAPPGTASYVGQERKTLTTGRSTISQHTIKDIEVGSTVKVAEVMQVGDVIIAAEGTSEADSADYVLRKNDKGEGAERQIIIQPGSYAANEITFKNIVNKFSEPLLTIQKIVPNVENDKTKFHFNLTITDRTEEFDLTSGQVKTFKLDRIGSATSASYIVTETAVDGYKLEGEQYTRTGSVNISQTKTETFTNKKLGSLIIRKTVVNGDPDDTFAFNLVVRGGDSFIDEQSFSLKNGEREVFNEYDIGNTFTVTEDIPADRDYITSVSISPSEVGETMGYSATGEIIEDGVTVIFINTKRPKKGDLVVRKEVPNYTNDLTLFQFFAYIGENALPETFVLSSGQFRAWRDLDVGTLFQIQEVSASSPNNLNDYETTPASRNVSGSVQEGGSVITFTNKRLYTPSPSREYTSTEVSGTGDIETRTNEITPDNVAAFRDFALGYNSTAGDIGGVIQREGHDFQVSLLYQTVEELITFIYNPWFSILQMQGNDKLKVNFICDGKQYDTIYVERERDADGNWIGDNVFYGYNGEYTKIATEDQTLGHDRVVWENEKYKTITLTNNNFSESDITYKWLKEYSDMDLPASAIIVSDGMCFAYGYAGYCQGREITFFPPAVEQYQIIYAEIDRSVIPNKISIKTKNNQSSSTILLNTFRQDALSLVKTGKFQVPLWLVKLSNQGIEELKSLRPLRKYIDRVVYSDNTSRISGTIAANAEVEGEMKPLDTNDKTVATTEWTKSAIEQEIRR